MAAAIPTPHSEVVDELFPAPKPADDEEIVDLNTVEPAAAEPAAAAPEPEKKAPPAPAADDEDASLPENLRGKSRKDIAKMYAEAQTLIGRQGGELGELRKRADMAIEASFEALRSARKQPPAATEATPSAPAAVDDTDFFRAPQDAVKRAIEQSPLIQQIQKTLGETAKAQAMERASLNKQRFDAAHPDAAQIASDPEFMQWVNSSRYRAALLNRAHTGYDFEAGDELFGTYKALRKAATPPPAATAPDVSEAARTLAAAKRKQAVDAAAAPSGGNAAPAKTGAKKIFRRADVLTLMETNPERYEQLSQEIELAYREGRVR